MNESKPTVYVLHGDDHFGILNFIDGMTKKMGDPVAAQMNISRLQSGVDSDIEIRSACLAIPFLTDRRLVIVMGYEDSLRKVDSDTGHDADAKKRKEGHRREILEFLGNIPQSTALFLVVEDEWVREKGTWSWKTLPAKHWLQNWMENNKSIAYYHVFPLPRGRDMITWITGQAKKMGGQISPSAAQALANAIGNDTQLAYHELDKLFTYVNKQRTVEVADVDALTAPIIKESIFELADAIGQRDCRRALDALHELLAESASEELIGMIIRQFRLLIIIKEALGTAMSLTDMTILVKLPAGIVEKYITQAKGYSLVELKGIYQRLLTLDLSNKTGQMQPNLALETFIVSLANQGRSS
jgi:DNA polymerase III subunit delta